VKEITNQTPRNNVLQPEDNYAIGALPFQTGTSPTNAAAAVSGSGSSINNATAPGILFLSYTTAGATAAVQRCDNQKTSTVNVQSLKELSVIEIANRIKEDLGSDPSLSVIQVIQAACEQVLTPSQAAEVSSMTQVKQNIGRIATFLGTE